MRARRSKTRVVPAFRPGTTSGCSVILGRWEAGLRICPVEKLPPPVVVCWWGRGGSVRGARMASFPSWPLSPMSAMVGFRGLPPNFPQAEAMPGYFSRRACWPAFPMAERNSLPLFCTRARPPSLPRRLAISPTVSSLFISRDKEGDQVLVASGAPSAELLDFASSWSSAYI